MRRTRFVSAVFACAAGACVQRGAGPATPEPTLIAGTYAVTVCREQCDPTLPEQALVEGHIVLEDRSFSYIELPRTVRTYLERYVPVLTALDAGDSPNACFALTKRPGARTYAGIASAGVTRWAHHSTAAIEIPLFHSPDAGYDASVTIQGAQLRGTGVSWGSGTGDEPIPTDSILGRRIGSPDRSLCIRAAEAAAARQRS